MFSDLLFRLRALFRRNALEGELDEELRAHLQRYVEKLAATGLSREEAARQARLHFGGLNQVKEECRDARGVNLIENLLQDLRYGLRGLRRNPGFAAAAILTLSLGIGATTAIFSVVDAVMLKPLPFPTAGRLVRVLSVTAATGHGGVASYPDFLDLRARNHVFDGIAVSHTQDFTLIGVREPMHLQGAVISAQLFSLLGITPVVGRNFLPAEDKPGAANGADPVILSYGLWQREFGSDVSVLGRTIRLADHPFTVVGIMPRAFQYPIQTEPVELWTTIAVDASGPNAMTDQRGAHYLDVIGLLKRGVTRERAQSEMAAIAGVLNKEHPENKPRSVRIVPEIEGLIGPLRTPLFVLLGAVSFVLLIVCANVASLLLARAPARSKEMAMRAALGASRWRITCQLLTESAALGLLGGSLGLGLAFASLRFLVRLFPVEVPRLNGIGLDVRLLIFAFLISLAAGILFGLAPALRVSKINLAESLKESGRGPGSGGRERSRMRGIVVVSEVALALVLLVGAGLLIQTFLHLESVDPGFNPYHVLTFQLDPPPGKSGPALETFTREVLARISALPGVSSASTAASLPLMGDNISSSIEIEGQPTPMGSRPGADFNSVEPNYFRTVGISLLAGRDFTENDDSKSIPVVIVNRTLARRFFPGQNPIGKHVRPGIGNGYGPGELPMREIVGVIGDVKESGLGAEAPPEVYAPLAQSSFGTMSFAIRTATDPLGIVPAARRQIAAVDRNAPIYQVETLDEYFAQSVAVPRFVALLLTGFAGSALLLACVGIYGVISYTVVQRTHEIGVRIALGANARDLTFWVLRQGLLLAFLGVTIGLAGSFGVVHLLSGLLYGVRATDPATFAIAPLVLLSVALLASYIPARRAALIDPVIALREE